MSIPRQSIKSKHFDLIWTTDAFKYLDPLKGKVILRFEIQSSTPSHKWTLRPNGRFIFGPMRPNGRFIFDPIMSSQIAEVSVDPCSIQYRGIEQQGTVTGASISYKTIDNRDIGCIKMQERTQRGQGLYGPVLKIEYASSYGRDPAFSA